MISQQIELRTEFKTTLNKICRNLLDCRERLRDDNNDEIPLREDERDAISPLLSDGFELVGEGLGRIVVRPVTDTVPPRIVFKLARCGRDNLSNGVTQNQVEALFHSMHVESDLPLMPVLATHHGSQWIAMAHGKTVDVDKECVESFADRFSEVPQIHPEEISEVNMAKYKGEFRLADYGRSRVWKNEGF